MDGEGTQPIPGRAEAAAAPAPSPDRGPSRPAPRGLAGRLLSPIGLIPLGFLAAIVIVLVYATGFRNFGASFWSFDYNFIPDNPAGSSWGIGVFLVGSLVTAGIALFFATVLSLALAISITVYLPPLPSRVLTVLTNLVAGIPSVVVGIWGFVILAPYFGLTLEPSLRMLIGWVPGFGGAASDVGPWGLLLAIFVLTIMIVPLTTALMRESLRSVPRDVVEAGLALGATRWEVVRRVRLRVARRGLWSAVLLGFGRAIGESVAVAMVIGAVPKLPGSLYAPSTTVASFIFYQLDSAFFYPDLLQLLVEFSLVLLVVTLAINLVAQRLTRVELATATTIGLERE